MGSKWIQLIQRRNLSVAIKPLGPNATSGSGIL